MNNQKTSKLRFPNNSFLKNSLSGIIQTILSIGLVFVSIPIFIHTNGMKIYGVFSVLSIFGNLTLLFNLGLNTTLLKQLSGNKSIEDSNKQVSVSIIILFSITFLFSILILLFKNQILSGLIIDQPNLTNDINNVFSYFLVANIFVMIGQPFIALLQANNNFQLVNLLQLVYNVLNWGLIVAICQMRLSFGFFAFPALIASLIWFLLILLLSINKYKFKFHLFFSEKVLLVSIFKVQIGYSLKVYLNSIINFASEPILKLLVVKYFGTAAVGNFDIIIRIKTQSITLLQKAFEPLSSIIAKQYNLISLRSIVHTSEQAAIHLILPLILLDFLYLDPILKLWLKVLDHNTILGIKISIAFFCSSVIVTPNYYYLLFHNKVNDCIKLQILSITVNILLLVIGKNYIHSQFAPIISICGGILVAFIFNLYFQWRYLRSIIFDLKFIKSLLVHICSISFFVILVFFKANSFALIPILISSICSIYYIKIALSEIANFK